MEKNRKYPNTFQSPAERREKYRVAREAGVSPSWAARIRDFQMWSFRRAIRELVATANARKESINSPDQVAG